MGRILSMDNENLLFRNLGQALVFLRKRKSKKQYEAAQAAGFTRGQLSAYEAGRARPSLTSLERLLQALGCDLADLHVALRAVQAAELSRAVISGGGGGTGAAGRAGPHLLDQEITELSWRLLGLLRERGEDGLRVV
jgi:transcriptional regulator with XRE-family HTH domain